MRYIIEGNRKQYYLQRNEKPRLYIFQNLLEVEVVEVRSLRKLQSVSELNDNTADTFLEEYIKEKVINEKTLQRST